MTRFIIQYIYYFNLQRTVNEKEKYPAVIEIKNYMLS